MSTFGIVAIIVLPVLGGLIAWAGDVIGYRLGKSRRSLFGLRPRATARLVGVAVGVGLPLVGMATALVGSSYARQALFELDTLLRTQKTVQDENARLVERIGKSRQEAQAARQQASDLTRYNNLKAKDLVKTRASLASAQGRLGRAEVSLNHMQGSVRKLSLEANQLRSKRKELTAQLDKIQGRLDASQTRLAAAESNVTKAEEEVTRRQSRLNALQADLDRQEQAYLQHLAVASGPVIFEPGEEILRGIVTVPDSEAETVATLTQVVAAASAVARERGLPAGPDGLSVKLIRPLPADWKPTQDLPDPPAIVRYVARQLRSGEQKKFVVSVRAVVRVFEGESVPARVALWWVPYVRVFHEGEVVYAATIDGSRSRTEVFNQLYNLITKLVRREAAQRGLLPHPETGEFGSLPSDQLLRALDEVSERGEPVRVEITAARDTYTTDPLSVQIEVKADGQAAAIARRHRG